MMKINEHIEIVRSSRSYLSSMSIRSCDAIYAVLAKRYSRVGITIVDNLSDLEKLVASQPDLVFLGMQFVTLDHSLGLQDPGKIWISDYLDEHHIAYTGSGQEAHELEKNKPLAKQRVLDAGLNTSKFYVVRQNQPQTRENSSLSYPLFVKPTNRGGGLGIDSDSVANNYEQMNSKVLSIATKLKSDSLVEEYLPGREFSVAILKDELSDEFLVMPIERIPPSDEHGARYLSAAVKFADAGSSVVVTDKSIKDQVTKLAINAFHALGARDYGRIDIRLDKTGVPHFLEANLIPSLISGYGNFPKACVLNIGLDYEPMILSIVRLGLMRTVDMTDDELDKNSLTIPTLEAAFEVVNLNFS